MALLLSQTDSSTKDPDSIPGRALHWITFLMYHKTKYKPHTGEKKPLNKALKRNKSQKSN